MTNIMEEYNRFEKFIHPTKFHYFSEDLDDRKYIENFKPEFEKLDKFLSSFIEKFPVPDIDDYADYRYDSDGCYYHYHGDLYTGSIYHRIQSSVDHLILSLEEELKKINGYESIKVPARSDFLEKNKDHINSYLICALRNVDTEQESRVIEEYNHPEYASVDNKITIEKTFDLFDYIPLKLYVKEVYYEDEDMELNRYRALDGEYSDFYEEEAVIQWIPK